MNAGYGNVFTKRRKLVTYGSIGFLVAILLGGILWRQSMRIRAETMLWNAAYAGALDQRNRAESDVIYGNDPRAKAEIDAASTALATLATDTNERKSSVKKLKQDLAEIKDKLKKVVVVKNVTELTVSAAAMDGDLAAPIMTEDAAYVADNSTGAIVKITFGSRAVKTIRLPSSADRIVAGMTGKDHLLFATQSGKLIALKKSDDSSSMMAWSHSRSSSTVDVVLYASKLYALDSSKNQVWRSANSGNGFIGDVPYIKTTSEKIDNGISIAIDSNVYILQRDGRVFRYLSGGREGFSLAPIDPPLTSGAAIWTTAENERLAITDRRKTNCLLRQNGALKHKSPRRNSMAHAILMWTRRINGSWWMGIGFFLCRYRSHSC